MDLSMLTGITGNGAGYPGSLRTGVPSGSASVRPPAAGGGAAANGGGSGGDARGVDGLTEAERKQVSELKDQEVRTHEQAHQAAGGPYASAPTYDYQQGPDGKRYAVGGEVQIDTSPERNPQATITKMEVVKRAALAPAEPSPQDRKVAALADRQRLEAQGELRAQEDAEREAEAARRDLDREKAKVETESRNQDSAALPGFARAERAVEVANRKAIQAYERVAALGGQARTPGALAVA